MEGVKLGKMCLNRAEEFAIPENSPYEQFPALPQGAVEANMDWLAPDYMDTSFDPPVTRTCSHMWVIQTEKNTVVVDTCVGNDKTRVFPFTQLCDHRTTPVIENMTEQLGIKPEDVDYVLHTHLHLDHVGFDTTLVDGKWVPTFPNAKYVYGKKEYLYRRHSFRNDLPTGEIGEDGTFEDSVLPIVEAGKAIFADDGFTLDLGDMCIKMEAAEGHAYGNMIIKASSQGETCVFCADILKHPIQLRYPDCPYLHCADQEDAMETSNRVLKQCADYHYLVCPTHWSAPYCAYIATEGDHYKIESYPEGVEKFAKLP